MKNERQEEEHRLEVRVAEDRDFERLKQLCDCHDGWSLAYNHPPTKVWTRPTKNSTFQMIKVCTVYTDIDANVLYDVLHDPHYRQMWDKHMIKSVDVGYLNPNNDVSYYAIACPAPLKNRDFVLQRSWLDTGRELYVLNHSVFHHQYPPRKGFVRGLSHLTGYLIRPLPSGGCSFSYVSHCDPRGKLPPWLVNKLTHVLAPKMVKTLHKACMQYLTWKPRNNPNYKPWIYPEQISIPRIAFSQCTKSPADDMVEMLDESDIDEKALEQLNHSHF
ncbi:START domain-containing protein 10 isoform X1 [Penaeus vannamei]|uniref:START domain-containing protein 10 isoform X1 n=1 Tax=Penaeus vannamei TaxID=6689 RepID=UPI000F68562A|nr:START domain-containing protein 10-like isoform X1 [Penaeus vannamei]